MQLSSEQTVWLLGSLCSLHRILFDERLVLQAFPPPHDWPAFTRAATALGLKVGSSRLTPQLLKSLPVPAVAFLRTPANEGSAGEEGQADVLPGRTPGPLTSWTGLPGNSETRYMFTSNKSDQWKVTA